MVLVACHTVVVWLSCLANAVLFRVTPTDWAMYIGPIRARCSLKPCAEVSALLKCRLLYTGVWVSPINCAMYLANKSYTQTDSEQWTASFIRVPAFKHWFFFESRRPTVPCIGPTITTRRLTASGELPAWLECRLSYTGAASVAKSNASMAAWLWTDLVQTRQHSIPSIYIKCS